jgi:hypothetical protein
MERRDSLHHRQANAVPLVTLETVEPLKGLEHPVGVTVVESNAIVMDTQRSAGAGLRSVELYHRFLTLPREFK